jgi:hypothetical protein
MSTFRKPGEVGLVANGHEKWKEERSRNFASLLFEGNKFRKMGPTQGRSYSNSSFVFLCDVLVRSTICCIALRTVTLHTPKLEWLPSNVFAIYATIFVIFSETIRHDKSDEINTNNLSYQD